MGWLRFSYRFILLPSFAGFACYGCSTSQIVGTDADNKSTINPSQRSSDQTSAAESSPSHSYQAEASTGHLSTGHLSTAITPSAAYHEAINLASSAYVLSQSALSPDDWELIASRWLRATEQLKTLDPTDPNYDLARQKIAEYARNAEAANAQLAQLQSPAYIPLKRGEAALAPASRTVTASDPSVPAPVRPSAAKVTQQSVRIPITRRLHGTPVVNVTFNGARTYEMILDTGASRTLITRSMANDLGVIVTDRMIAATASQASVGFDIGQIRSMSVGSASAGSVTLEGAQVSIGDAVNVGLLGNDFLRDYDVIIRAREGVIELIPADYN